MDLFDELKAKLDDDLQTRQEEFENVSQSQHYLEQRRFLYGVTFDFLHAVRNISIYSTRARAIYDECLTVRATDDLIQSVIAISLLVQTGAHNIAKREIRYLLEMTVKYLLVDQKLMGQPLTKKIQYLHDLVPNSSIEVVDELALPFPADDNKRLKNDVKDLFYKACAFTHPSKQQIEEQLRNYDRGIHIGFETAKMLDSVNKTLFRGYDLILSMLFIGFGHSMSGDLFIEIYDHQPKWKFHKGKHVREFTRLFDYKSERAFKNSD